MPAAAAPTPPSTSSATAPAANRQATAPLPLWGPGMYMKTALVPKGARAVRLSNGAGDGKSKDLLRKSLFRCGPSALACCAGKCSRISSAPHPAGFDSRRPARKRKRLWSQMGPEPLIYLVERATGIEPASSAWKAGVLPLNYARKIWSGRQDLNLRHPAPKAGALPNCATSRRC